MPVGFKLKIKQRSLRFELVVSLVLMVAAAAGFMGALVFQYTQREMIALKIETGILLAEAVEALFTTHDANPSPQFMAGKLIANRFESLAMMDRFGRRISDLGVFPEPLMTGILKRTITSGEVQTDLTGTGLLFFLETPRLVIGVPLYKSDRVVAAIGLHSELPELRRTWDRTRWIIIVYLGLDTLLMVLFGFYVIARRLVEPLRNLVHRVEALAAGQYHPQEDRHYEENEIGRLNVSFEQMARRILDQKSRLEENIASLKETQENLIQSEKMASVGRLGAGLAHELGNPLGAVLGFIHLLRMPDLTHGQRTDFLDRMETEITRMDGIIRSLLDYARPSTPAPGPVSLKSVVENALSLASVQKWFSGIRVDTDLDESLPPVRGEFNRLTQILLNLLENAGQAMDGEGRVNIRTEKGDGEVFLIVSDTGPGIPEDQQHYVFDPFFTTKEPGHGTGLGLAVSQSIAQSFGGRIQVAGREGEGAVFTVILTVYQISENENLENHDGC